MSPGVRAALYATRYIWRNDFLITRAARTLHKLMSFASARYGKKNRNDSREALVVHEDRRCSGRGDLCRRGMPFLRGGAGYVYNTMREFGDEGLTRAQRELRATSD